jgi:hypothetical protein
MFKRILSAIGLLILVTLLTGILTAAAPIPNVTIVLVSGLPATMNVGDTATVVVQITSDQEFNYAQMLPTFYFPGRDIIAVRGGDHVGSGTSATLEITFKAKGSTVKFGGAVPVSVVAGVRFRGGYVVSQRFDFNVTVP